MGEVQVGDLVFFSGEDHIVVATELVISERALVTFHDGSKRLAVLPDDPTMQPKMTVRR